ncbi:MAG TPA: SBBP repeat-containing protein [Planctomycetota bacterium]|nr:SBBP repeat-containing protein [Planctomycetota bacterium]
MSSIVKSLRRQARASFAVFVTLMAGSGALVALVPVADLATGAGAPRVQRALPIATLNGFVENRGQWDGGVRFFARSKGIDATLLGDALAFRPTPDSASSETPPEPLVLRLPHGAVATGENALPTEHHFISGAGTTSHVHGFERVLYRDVMPGLDIAVRHGDEGFEYDVQAAPGARLEDLVLEVEGAQGLEIIRDNVLVLHTAYGPVEQRIGAAWQTSEKGDRIPVQSRFRLLPSHEGIVRFGFEAPDRDPESAFVLDPSLVYATYVGGSGQEILADMDVGPSGAVYLTCRSAGPSPVTPGALQVTPGGSTNAWVGKLAPSGGMLEWGTYLGGNKSDEPFGVSVDSDGSVVVTGDTWSPDFPTTEGSLQPVFGGGSGNDDLFISRLAADGASLVASTFYGGTDFVIDEASTVLPGGDIVVACTPNSGDTPATPGAFDPVFQPHKQMLIRISADCSRLVFQTYFKASGISHIASDQDENVYFTGYVFPQDAPMPSTPGVFEETMPSGIEQEAFVAKLDPTGTQLVWATYLGGGEGSDSIIGLAVDAASAVYVAGLTDSDNYPVTPGAFATALTNGGDGFVTKLLPCGTGLVWSTYLGANSNCSSLIDSIVVDTAGNAIAVGDSNGPNFPTTPDAFQKNFAGPEPLADSHLTKLDPFGETLVYSTWFGGNSNEYLTRVGLDAAQQPYMSCLCTSTNVPVTSHAYDKTYGGGSGDMVVARFNLPLAPWVVLGGGLKGTADIANLAGGGQVTSGTPTRLSVRGGKASAPAYLVVGLSSLDLPLKGGTLVPAPDLLVPLGTNAQGAMDLSFAWPAVPAGLALTLQLWIKDQGVVQGWSASNALRIKTH